ncbi:hypothetical protein JYU34_011699 [Plutella xylostella]|uniref:Uncharacterized protein n=1 Tax=Plutella xylostella TaxID=51655 RepID=A0ABQ7QDE2_PLUXY|nr:uncharacterized protein LOC105382220 isoform X2 [Plutella xylostella]KAG7303232.1 hypothetical protein JYU34_011699 [Plutella xylostella]
MYRTLLLIIVSVSVSQSAPQDQISQDQADQSDSRIENLPLTIPGNSDKTIREIPDETEETTPYPEDVTETDIYEDVKTTIPDYIYKTTKAPPPKFYSKLSYFEKASEQTGALRNLVELGFRSNRRKFRSNCRCEKISNCPKLQITVPRCPEEQFMCCF